MSSETELDAEGLDAHRREVSRLTAENKLLRAAADPAKVGAVGDLVKHATRLVQIERDDARAERDALKAATERTERLRDKWLSYPVDDMHYAAGLMLARHLSGEAFALDVSGGAETACSHCDGTGIVPGTEELVINTTGEPCACRLLASGDAESTEEGSDDEC